MLLLSLNYSKNDYVLSLVFIFQEVSIAYEDCPAQVVVTTQAELKHQIRAEINRAFLNITAEGVGERCLLEETDRNSEHTQCN
jgi:hypothetical protein